jgi:hypothetical protein
MAETVWFDDRVIQQRQHDPRPEVSTGQVLLRKQLIA